ncbi:MAG: hypothetical protein AAGF12_34525 [Myxococcota bacterium]
MFLRRITAILAILVGLGCGARSGVEGPTPSDAAPDRAAEVSDASLDAAVLDGPGVDAAVSARAIGVWRFHTVRALCDTMAVAICEDDDVFIRLSPDDLCDGANPLGGAPFPAMVDWTSSHDVTLRFDIVGESYELMLRLVEAPDAADDRLQLVDFTSTGRGFRWEDGIREGTDRFPPLPADFITCG